MNVQPLLPDAAPTPPPAPLGDGFATLLDAAASRLRAADAAETAFAAHQGGLQEMVVERARADIALSLAAATAQRVAQGVQTLLAIQV